ncbi:hypothetical protein [Chryseobacterium camelliae]|uniref:hypothetical protein n=1 Tax=Chryseobacterium camelliae TaxID=1265445 RepID=UPI0028614094|nr:hypothetical protein [Chryseobacterium camelliae]MDR6515929.1 hypothetical protein [Chryseobacterium camelliae]
MKIVLKTKHVIFFVVFCVLIYVAFKTYNFQKYSNEIDVRDEIPIVTLNTLLNKQLNVKYLKSFYYNNKCIGYNAILDDKYYISVIKLGHAEKSLEVKELKVKFKENDVIGLPPIDTEEQLGKYLNFESYPFIIDQINYYIDGQKYDSITDKFYEIVFTGNYINFSLNNKNQKDFGYVTSKQKMSVSFINYKNELYIINTKPYKNNSFIDLHNLIK